MDFSEITNDLFIGTTPTLSDYDALRDLGVRLVINMRFMTRLTPDPHPQPLSLLWLRTIDSPLSLIPIQKLVVGTRAALETIRAGGKVYSHCAKGRHRSVAMGAAILIAQGHSPEAAMQLIKQQRPISDPGMFYIRSRILYFEKQWQALKKEFQKD
jgi:dual specificity MAP kinase phosphatase